MESPYDGRRFLELAESMAGLGRWRLDIATREAVWSDTTFKVYGVEPGRFEPTLDRVLALCDPRDRAEVSRRVHLAIETGRPFEGEYRVILPDGAVRRIRSGAVCELDADGKVAALCGIVPDMTESVARFAALEEDADRYRRLSEDLAQQVRIAEEQTRRAAMAEQIAGLGRWRLDAATREVAWSPQMYVIYGIDPSQPLELGALMAMTDEEDRQAAHARLERALSTGEGSEADLRRIRRADGSLRYARGSIAAERGPDGSIVAAIGTLLDVTEHVHIRMAAEAASAAKAEFLANMSHELRTPLTAVLGYSRLAAEQPELGPTTRGYLSRVLTGGQALLATINDILDFSRLEAGQVEIERAPADPGGMAKETMSLFVLQAAEKNLRLDHGGLDDLPALVMIDGPRVRQVLLNLIGNAVKFTPSGRVSLEGRFEPAAGRLTFSVADTGPGISAEGLKRLFQRFSQVDGSSTRIHSGTGLGLAISKGLVEAMGGEIGVESVEGEGSRFWFAIPAAAARRPAETARQPAGDGGASLNGRRLLIADDNAANLALVRAVLSPFDMEIAAASNGLEAVALAQASPFDAILMDLRMPSLDGAGAARRIRAEGLNEATPIIAFSAEPSAPIDESLFDDRVGKPLSAAQLIEAIARAIDPPGPFTAAA